MDENADVVIVGGGPVGSALALALRPCGWRVVLLEAQAIPVPDRRPVAIAYGSRLILERLGAWPQLAVTATPIRHIHVSQRGGFGRVALEASEAGLPELGYVVDYMALAHELSRAAGTAERRMNALVTSWQPGSPAQVYYKQGETSHALKTPLLVVADGGGLVDADVVDYQQSAVTARVISTQPHGCRAYERFTAQGPLALLPDGEGWALVWTVSCDRANALCAMSGQQFLAELRREFGARAGEFSAVSGRKSYPLQLRRAAKTLLEHTVLIGNAAQTLHPVAGQGFNLGLRDAWELAAHALDCREAPGSRSWMDQYLARRKTDRSLGVGFTHALVQLFSNDAPLLRVARGAGLAVLGGFPPFKNFLVKRMTFGARG